MLLGHGRVRVVSAIVLALDFLDDALHLLALLLPLRLCHLELFAEQLVVGLAVRSAETVPEGGVLAVVVVEVQAVDNWSGTSLGCKRGGKLTGASCGKPRR